MNIQFKLLATLALSSAVALPAFAAVSQDQADRLGKDLTPMGAERAGNAAGTIPEWEPINGIPEGITHNPGERYPDPFPGDKPLFEITAANLEQYKDNLTEGQLALFEKHPETYKMVIYQTRRSAALPEWVYENAKKNAVTAQLSEDGNAVSKAYGAVPFPIANNGLEAIWNHTLRYQGETLRIDYEGLTLQRGGKYTRTAGTAYELMPFYQTGKDLRDTFGDADDYFNAMFITTAPPRKNGEVTLVRDPMNQSTNPRKAWLYLPGQRRVRRAPNIAYDTPSPGSNGTTTYDDTWLFNGAPDRYNWELVGKKEIYIPYNNAKLEEKAEFEAIMGKDANGEFTNFVNPELTRYELHRVYEVVATLKEDARHIYGTRKFYMDEDSWMVVLADSFDTRGELWRTNIAFSVNRYDLPGNVMFSFTAIDLKGGSMNIANMLHNTDESYFFNEPMNEKFFTPGSVRKLSRR